MTHDRKGEFFAHVWDHTKDDFFDGFAKPRDLTDSQRRTIKEIICILCRNKGGKVACDLIYRILKSQPTDSSIIPIILQLVGSTRNKILTDLRAMLSGTDIKVPNKPELVVKNSKLLGHAEKYITDELKRVFASIIDKDCNVDDDTLCLILDILNQSTWSGYVRQEKAKRTGHYAEYRLAKELDKIGIPFEPRKKLDKHPSADVTFRGLSYDLVIPDAERPKICVKATTHTSNIGQYGESKDALEVTEAKTNLDELPELERPLLVSLIDGIGFQSNISGLTAVLDNSDEFVQFKTMWKIAVLYAKTTPNRKIGVWLPDPENHEDFLSKHADDMEIMPDDKGLVQVGEGAVETFRSPWW